MREFTCELTSSWPPARVEGGSDGAVPDPFPLDPVDPVDPLDPVDLVETVGELSLQNRPSIFVHRRGGLETYLSKPPCLSLKNDTLKNRGFVEPKRHFAKKTKNDVS